MCDEQYEKTVTFGVIQTRPHHSTLYGTSCKFVVVREVILSSYFSIWIDYKEMHLWGCYGSPACLQSYRVNVVLKRDMCVEM